MTRTVPLPTQMSLLWNWDLCIQACVYICVCVCVYSFLFTQILLCDHKHSWWAVDWMTKYFCKPHLWSLNPLFSGGKIIPTVPVSLVCTYSSLSLSFLSCFPVSSSWTSPYVPLVVLLPSFLCLSVDISCLYLMSISNVLYHPPCLGLCQLKSCLCFRAELRCPLLRVVQQLVSFLSDTPEPFAPAIAFVVFCFV